MRRWGVFLVVTGFGSVALHYFTDLQFRVLAWADDRQPGVGIGVGLVGLLLLFGPTLLSIRKTRGATPSFPGSGPVLSTGIPGVGFGQPAQSDEPAQFPPAQPGPPARFPVAQWGQAAPYPPAQPGRPAQFRPAQLPPARFPAAQPSLPGQPSPGQFPPPRFGPPAPASLPTQFQLQPGRLPQPPQGGQQPSGPPIDRTVRINPPAAAPAQPVDRTVHLSQPAAPSLPPDGRFPRPGQPPADR